MKAEQRISPHGPRRIPHVGFAALTVVGSVLLLLIIFHASTPLQAGPLGILIVFGLLYALFVALFFVVISLVSAVIARLGVANAKNTRASRRVYYVASVLGFIPVLYLTLASRGGVTIGETVLIFLFVGLSLFYVLRRL